MAAEAIFLAPKVYAIQIVKDDKTKTLFKITPPPPVTDISSYSSVAIQAGLYRDEHNLEIVQMANITTQTVPHLNLPIPPPSVYPRMRSEGGGER